MSKKCLWQWFVFPIAIGIILVSGQYALKSSGAIAAEHLTMGLHPLRNIIQVSADAHTCALTNGGGVKCWGHNTDGDLGDGTFLAQHTPVNVINLNSGVAAISVGLGNTCALTSVGGVKCWGDNVSGQLGDGSQIPKRNSPVDVIGLDYKVKSITVSGYSHVCALTTMGGVKCWGNNYYGQLGDGSNGNFHGTPVDVIGLSSGVAAISAREHHTCAITNSGGVKCWGKNQSGVLGDGTTTNQSNPVGVIGLTSGITVISTGTSHTCALTNTGGVKCWGDNHWGQLGDGTSTNSYTPVDVIGLSSGITAVSSGEGHTCVLTTVGGVKCWGSNYYGQLGDGTNVSRYAPVDVVGLSSGVTAISVGTTHTCALTSSGGVKCWGQNWFGQLGDDTEIDRNMPVDVMELDSDTYAISGRVTDSTGNPVAGVIVKSNSGSQTATDANGVYTMTTPIVGSYIFTPTKSNFFFTPLSRTVSIPPNAADQNFTGTPVTSSCVSDEFDTSSLSPNWTWVDPLADSIYSLKATSGNLRIATPSGHHDLNPGYDTNAPRLLQSINGDFDVTTKVTVSPIYTYQAAGLLVWFDSGNFVFINRATSNRVEMRYMRAFKELQPASLGGITNTTVYFRITRSGNTFSTYYSVSGSDWTQTGSIEYPSAPISASVGLFVLNNWQDHLLAADFDYFHCVRSSSVNLTPVIFIAGIAGSQLRRQVNFLPDEYLWPVFSDTPKLKLTLNPKKQKFTVYTDDVIRSYDAFNIPFNVLGLHFHNPVYGPFLARLREEGYMEYQTNGDPIKRQVSGCDKSQKNSSLFVLPWDWRYGVTDAEDPQLSMAPNNVELLKEYIDCVRLIHPGSDVIIVAHSMGGLLARKYIMTYPSNHHVIKLVTMGTPWLGAPKAIAMMLNGNFSDLIRPDTTRTLLEYFPGAHQLLPSRQYYDLISSPLGYPFMLLNPFRSDELNPIDYNGFDAALRSRYRSPAESLDYRSTVAFMGNNEKLFDKAEFADWTQDDSKVEYHILYGEGLNDNTIHQVRELFHYDVHGLPSRLDYDTKVTLGDTTVPLESSTRQGNNHNLNGSAYLYRFKQRGAEDVEHSSLPSNTRVQNCVLKLLGKPLNCDSDTVSTADSQADALPARYVKLWGITSLYITDGINTTENLMTSTLSLGLFPHILLDYLGSDAVQLIISDEKQYTMTFTGNDYLDSESILGTGSKPQHVVRYVDSQVVTGTQFVLTTSLTALSQLMLDSDHNGSPDILIAPSSDISGNKALDNVIPTIQILFAPETRQMRIMASDDNSGVERILYSLDGQRYQLYSQPITVDKSVTKVYALAEDQMGNFSNLVTQIIPSTFSSFLPFITR